MKYMGSKNRLSKFILPIILENREEGSYYIEPFSGGCNSLDKVDGLRIANDKNRYLISMWKDLIKGIKFPKIIEREIYNAARTSFNNNDNNFTDGYIGWIGFMASYNGRFFDGGYSGHNVGKEGRDYIGEQIRNTMKQIPLLKDVVFNFGDYDEMEYPDNSTIYCDIPYNNTAQYVVSKNFNYDKFYQWCINMEKLGHNLFISEYNMPEDLFECVFEKKVTNSMHQTKTKRPTEKLYKVRKNKQTLKIN